MKIYYRISNNSYKKNRLPNATKEHCLEVFLKYFDNSETNIIIVADNVTDIKLSEFIDTRLKNNITRINTSLNNAGSFKYCLQESINISNNSYIYFAEDDYLYTDKCYNALKEGLSIANYVTLYDHPDKYIDAINGGNPQIDGGGEITRVVKTNNFHWKLTNSTTLTFGCSVKVLKEDIFIWEKYLTTSYPRDYDAFCDLIQNNQRSLISPIPGLATHSEIQWLAPFTNWEKI